MKGRRAAAVASVVLLFIPCCVVLYSIACTIIGEYAEPIVAPRPPLVIIDHFHVEVYVEALFLALGIILWSRHRALVWVVGVLGIPIVPHFVLTAIEPGLSLPGPPLWRDLLLWSLESLGAGIVACALWQLACRALGGRPARQGSVDAQPT